MPTRVTARLHPIPAILFAFLTAILGCGGASQSSGVATTPIVEGLYEPIMFGAQYLGNHFPESIPIYNTSSLPLVISSVTITGPNASAFTQTNNCTTAPVAGGLDCTINITFSPNVAGSESATLTITDNAPGSPQSQLLLGSAIVTPNAALQLSGTALTFTSLPIGMRSAAQTVTATNSGSAGVTIGAILLADSTYSFSQSNTCSNYIAAGASCTVTVTFIPTTTGAISGTITFLDDASTSPQIITLIGAGLSH